MLSPENEILQDAYERDKSNSLQTVIIGQFACGKKKCAE